MPNTTQKEDWITKNLIRCKLEDHVVVTRFQVVKKSTGEVSRLVEMKPFVLSTMCAHMGMIFHYKMSYEPEEGPGDRVEVVKIHNSLGFQREEKLGHIDAAGTFHFTEAPSLEQALGWATVTDYGQLARIRHNIFSEAEDLMKVIREAPFSSDDPTALKDYYFGPYEHQVTEAMAYCKGSRFGNNTSKKYLPLFWQVGTRILNQGTPHPGFPTTE